MSGVVLMESVLLPDAEHLPDDGQHHQARRLRHRKGRSLANVGVLVLVLTLVCIRLVWWFLCLMCLASRLNGVRSGLGRDTGDGKDSDRNALLHVARSAPDSSVPKRISGTKRPRLALPMLTVLSLHTPRLADVHVCSNTYTCMSRSVDSAERMAADSHERRDAITWPELFKNQPYSYKSDIWSLGYLALTYPHHLSPSPTFTRPLRHRSNLPFAPFPSSLSFSSQSSLFQMSRFRCVLLELVALRHAFEARDMKSLVNKIIRGAHAPVPGTNACIPSFLLLPVSRASVSYYDFGTGTFSRHPWYYETQRQVRRSSRAVLRERCWGRQGQPRRGCARWSPPCSLSPRTRALQVSQLQIYLHGIVRGTCSIF